MSRGILMLFAPLLGKHVLKLLMLCSGNSGKDFWISHLILCPSEVENIEQ